METRKYAKGSVHTAVCAVLVCVGLVKVLSAFGEARILLVKDDLLGVQYRTIYVALGLLEIGVGLAAKCWCWPRVGMALVFGLGFCFIAYHAISGATGVNSSCPCLGSLLDWAPGLARNQSSISIALAIWLVLLSGWAMWRFSGKVTDEQPG